MRPLRIPGPAAVSYRTALDLLAPAAFGGLATLGFAPFGYYGLTLLALAGLIALWWPARAGRGAWRGFVFGLAHFSSGVYWVFVSVHDYGGAPTVAAAAATVGLVAYMALYPAAVGAFAGATRGLPRTLWALLLVPGAWLLGELMRSWVFTGFPWLSLGYALTDAPVSPIAPIGGVYALGFLMMAAAGTFVLLLAGTIAARALAVAIIALAPIALWLLPPAAHWTHRSGAPVSVDVIQGNVPQAIKWQPDALAPTLRRYRDLTRRSHADLVVWPEAAIPATVEQVGPYLAAIGRMAARRHQTVLAGVLARPNDDGPYYNAVFALGAGHGHYTKRHRVPFGEFFPVPDFVRGWLGGMNMPVSDLGFGPARQPLIRADGAALGLSICFEDAFGYEIARALPAAGILVNVTNDAWFTGTTAAAQHLQIARMRALEAGRPLVRAANTGISAIIGYDGLLRQVSRQNVVARVSDTVVPRAGLTPYMRYRDRPLWWAGFMLVVAGLLAAWLRRRAVT